MKQIIYILIIAILAILLLLSVKSCTNKQREVADISYNLKHLQDSTTYWVNKYGIEVAANTNLQGTLAELKITNQKDLDELHKQLGVKEKRIQGLQKVTAAGKVKFTTKVDTSHHGDTSQQFTHSQPFISVTETTIGDSAHVVIHDTIPITIAQTWDRKWFLGSITHKVQAFSTRPDVTITGLQSVTVIKEKPKVLSKIAYLGAGIVAGFLIFHK